MIIVTATLFSWNIQMGFGYLISVCARIVSSRSTISLSSMAHPWCPLWPRTLPYVSTAWWATDVQRSIVSCLVEFSPILASVFSIYVYLCGSRNTGDLLPCAHRKYALRSHMFHVISHLQFFMTPALQTYSNRSVSTAELLAFGYASFHKDCSRMRGYFEWEPYFRTDKSSYRSSSVIFIDYLSHACLMVDYERGAPDIWSESWCFCYCYRHWLSIGFQTEV